MYLYEFKNTPERGVGPDPRLTVQGITEGTQIRQDDVRRQLQQLIDRAFVRAVLVGRLNFHYLTLKGYNYVERAQIKSLNMGIDRRGFGFGFQKTETQGTKTS
jgi:hypothetical protein